MNINVTASEFIQVVFSDRQEQSSKLGKWFSPKETGKQLKAKAGKYLDNYKDYVGYLEQVVKFSDEELDKELFKAKVQRQLKNMSDEEKQLMIQTLQG